MHARTHTDVTYRTVRRKHHQTHAHVQTRGRGPAYRPRGDSEGLGLRYLSYREGLRVLGLGTFRRICTRGYSGEHTDRWISSSQCPRPSFNDLSDTDLEVN